MRVLQLSLLRASSMESPRRGCGTTADLDLDIGVAVRLLRSEG